MWVEVILPLAVENSYSYLVPVDWQDQIEVGRRVEVPVRRKHYAGIISKIGIDQLDGENLRPIVCVLDDFPVVTDMQLRFWFWMAKYYCCTVGEVMNVAMPSGLKLSSETKVALNPYVEHLNNKSLTTKQQLIIDALSNREVMTLKEVQELLNQKTVMHLLRELLQHRLIFFSEDLSKKYKPKVIDEIQLAETFANDMQDEAFWTKIKRSKKQQKVVEFLLREEQIGRAVPKSEIYAATESNSQVLRSLEIKGIINIQQKTIDRINVSFDGELEIPPLSDLQSKALNMLDASLDKQNIALLHGVTGSGKTQLYIHQIKKIIDRGGQVLYMLPEIALTSQMLSRLTRSFGDQVIFYHSRMTIHEQVEVWNRVMHGHPIVIGARSSVFLPFQNLEFIIIDEEHESSFKQRDPAPRYHGRDAGVMLGYMSKAKVVLGSATPSLESIINKTDGKYGYVGIHKRFGNAILPEIEVVDLKEQYTTGNKKNVVFSQELLEGIRECIEQKKQAILFQNRRGFAPTVRCFQCDWTLECQNCDVTMTMHKSMREMKCHYCSFRSNIPSFCPSCGNKELSEIGFGTERIEDQLSEIFPDIAIARMDQDTTRGKAKIPELIHKMETGQIDVLIGTQMVTKGLDFSNVTLVGILSADSLINFPDFRAAEKAFHLMTQVSGRAGRGEHPGKVMIQTYQPDHWLINKVLNQDFFGFANIELEERKDFRYPPFLRLIEITVKHSKRPIATKAAETLAYWLKKRLGNIVLGPTPNAIERLNNQYIYKILLKVEKKNNEIAAIKDYLMVCKKMIRKEENFSSVRVNIDVDPQ